MNQSHAAGGWGAVKSTAKAILDQKRVRKDIIALFEANQPNGFDCPGCAWGEPCHTSLLQVCENGAKAISWETTSKKTTPEFFKRHSVSELLTWRDFDLENQGRLTHPMKYNAKSDHYEVIEWDTAFKEIGETLKSYDDPNALELYTSGRTSNEAAFLYQLFGREFGTNNFPDCSNMCHEPTSVGLTSSIGIGKGTVSIEDFDYCDLIICVGHNPGTNHPRMLSSLRKASKRGAKIIAINPIKEVGLQRFTDPQSAVEMMTNRSTPLSSDYYQVKVGGDLFLVTGILRAFLEMHDEAVRNQTDSPLDLEFIRLHTHGFDALQRGILATDWQAIEDGSGLSMEMIQQIAHWYAKSERTIITYGLGITQHTHGTENVQQLMNLILLKGNIGKKGAGISPLRGHSNVQGNRTVGITEKPNAALLDRIEQTFGFVPPREHGHSAVEAIQAMLRGEAKALIACGGNFVIAMPDYQKTFDAVKNLDLSVHFATKLNRSHLITSKSTYLFPVLGRTDVDIQAEGEQFITVEDSMSMVHSSKGFLKPASPYLKSECEIIAQIAMSSIEDSKVDWRHLIANYNRIRDEIEKVFPIFKNFNHKVRSPGGFKLYNSASDLVWKTPTHKANFIAPNLRPVVKTPTLNLTTIRSHDQYNTTIYGLDDRYRGVFGRRDVLFLNETDAEGLNLVQGDVVNVYALDGEGQKTERSMQSLTVVIFDISARSAATYYPECNDLLNIDCFDPQSGIPSYKNIPIAIEKVV